MLCALTVAEIGHGIYNAGTPEAWRQRRMFLADLKAAMGIDPFTEATAEIAARVGAEEAAKATFFR